MIAQAGVDHYESFAGGRCLEIQVGDIVGFACAEAVGIARFNQGSPALLSSLAAVYFIRDHHSAEAARHDLEASFGALLAGAH